MHTGTDAGGASCTHECADCNHVSKIYLFSFLSVVSHGSAHVHSVWCKFLMSSFQILRVVPTLFLKNLTSFLRCAERRYVDL